MKTHAIDPDAATTAYRHYAGILLQKGHDPHSADRGAKVMVELERGFLADMALARDAEAFEVELSLARIEAINARRPSGTHRGRLFDLVWWENTRRTDVDAEESDGTSTFEVVLKLPADWKIGNRLAEAVGRVFDQHIEGAVELIEFDPFEQDTPKIRFGTGTVWGAGRKVAA